MPAIRTVLCPVDFSELGRRELSVGVEICRAFGAKLVVHHNLPISEPGFSKSWEWQEAHRKTRGSLPQAEAKLKELLQSIDPAIPTQATLSSGPLLHALMSLADQEDVDLIVLGSHGRETADHASLCDRIVETCERPVLCFEESGEQTSTLGLQPAAEQGPTKVLVPTDLSVDAEAALQYAFDLARQLPLHLHLLNVISGGQADTDAACRRLNEKVPADLCKRVECHARSGKPIDEIVACAGNLNPAFLVMGEHARGFLRAWLTRHTDTAVLHRVEAPVWLVPAEFGSQRH